MSEADATAGGTGALGTVNRTLQESRAYPYQLFMLVLCVYVLVALAAQRFTALSEETIAILEYVDFALCLIFFADFVGNLVFSKDRLGYLKWGWIDLISSIPMVGPLRVGRVARIVRILRVLRAIRSTKTLVFYVLQRRSESTLMAVSALSILLVVFASIAILEVEQVANANIQSPEDALWWAFVTITTVGYGDKFPVTSEGRIIAAILMTAGVGLFGTFTGYVASWFLDAEQEQQTSELDAIRAELAEMRRLLTQRSPADAA